MTDISKVVTIRSEVQWPDGNVAQVVLEVALPGPVRTIAMAENLDSVERHRISERVQEAVHQAHDALLRIVEQT